MGTGDTDLEDHRLGAIEIVLLDMGVWIICRHPAEGLVVVLKIYCGNLDVLSFWMSTVCSRISLVGGNLWREGSNGRKCVESGILLFIQINAIVTMPCLSSEDFSHLLIV